MKVMQPDKFIQRGDPVVTANGLVGYVIEVGRRFSWVLLISDVNRVYLSYCHLHLGLA